MRARPGWSGPLPLPDSSEAGGGPSAGSAGGASRAGGMRSNAAISSRRFSRFSSL